MAGQTLEEAQRPVRRRGLLSPISTRFPWLRIRLQCDFPAFPLLTAPNPALGLNYCRIFMSVTPARRQSSVRHHHRLQTSRQRIKLFFHLAGCEWRCPPSRPGRADMLLGTGYRSRNITCIPPSTGKADRELDALYTVVVCHSVCTCLFGGLPTCIPALNPTQLCLYVSSDPVVGTYLVTVTRVLKEAR